MDSGRAPCLHTLLPRPPVPPSVTPEVTCACHSAMSIPGPCAPLVPPLPPPDEEEADDNEPAAATLPSLRPPLLLAFPIKPAIPAPLVDADASAGDAVIGSSRGSGQAAA